MDTKNKKKEIIFGVVVVGSLLLVLLLAGVPDSPSREKLFWAYIPAAEMVITDQGIKGYPGRKIGVKVIFSLGYEGNRLAAFKQYKDFLKSSSYGKVHWHKQKYGKAWGLREKIWSFLRGSCDSRYINEIDEVKTATQLKDVIQNYLCGLATGQPAGSNNGIVKDCYVEFCVHFPKRQNERPATG